MLPVWLCLVLEDNEYQAALQSVDTELHLVTGGDDDIFFWVNNQLESGRQDNNMQSYKPQVKTEELVVQLVL